MSTAFEIEIRAVQAPQVLELRHRVLRPGRPIEAAMFDDDSAPLSWHAAAFLGPDVIGVASLFRRPFPFWKSLAWQLRGMAVAPEHRGQGVGRLVLGACVGHVAQEGGLLWCNARVSALGFYRAEGFEIQGEEFEIPDVGPHFIMSKLIARAEDASST